MNEVEIQFKNCYGIKQLDYTFDFSEKNGYLIYAPNGTMKTSFARSFQDISNGLIPKDKIYLDRISSCEIKADAEIINKDNILVVESYNENLSTEKVSTLMVNNKLKKEYDDIHIELNAQIEALLKKLIPVSGIKKIDEVEKLIKEIFENNSNIFNVIQEIIDTKKLDTITPVEGLKYSDMFNSKTEAVLENIDVQKAIIEYMAKYDELISQSNIYSKGIFNHNNAENIEKNLKENKFFKASHTLVMNGQNINSDSQLVSILKEEKEKVLTDPKLMAKFDGLDKLLTKNNEVRILRQILEQNNEIIPELVDLHAFKQKLWLSYLKQQQEDVEHLAQLYSVNKLRLKEIIDKAKAQQTDWYRVVEIFNYRFNVPFSISIDNQEEVILKESTAVLSFEYREGGEVKKVDRSQLLNVLSNGEKRALYILNVIFEIEARLKEDAETLLIIDDIADSFDYKNKYAIIEYLNDILEGNKFKMIILTHNFDFYRTVGSRLDIPRAHCLMTIKSERDIELQQGGYLKDVFNVWKKRLDKDNKLLIASIPFVRNMVEYIEEENSPNYLKLTGILHVKGSSIDITVKKLEEIYNEVWKVPKNFKAENKERTVLEIIDEEAEKICKMTIRQMNLENKIVLSIAIRIEAERFMLSKINDISVIGKITSNQTGELFRIYKQRFAEEKDIIRIISQVNLMTPENIHMNSFMYEPLLDMDEVHLISLYEKLKALNFEIIQEQEDIG